MPTYEYLCADCGPFTAFKPISQYKDPEPCPACAVAAPRVIMTAPVVRGAAGPATSTGQPNWLAGMNRHPSGCACC